MIEACLVSCVPCFPHHHAVIVAYVRHPYPNAALFAGITVCYPRRYVKKRAGHEGGLCDI